MHGDEEYMMQVITELGLGTKSLLDSPKINVLKLSNIIKAAWLAGFTKGKEWR